MLNVEEVRADFPILHTDAHPGVPLVYLDSAASSQKPAVVIDAMNDYYRGYNSNVHRGIHRLSEDATVAYEDARGKVRRFINAPSDETVIYTRNTTEAINLVAYSWARVNLQPGDEVLITAMEHHANIVPWQLITEMTGATLRHIPFNTDGTLDLTVGEAGTNIVTTGTHRIGGDNRDGGGGSGSCCMSPPASWR